MFADSSSLAVTETASHVTKSSRKTPTCYFVNQPSTSELKQREISQSDVAICRALSVH